MSAGFTENVNAIIGTFPIIQDIRSNFDIYGIHDLSISFTVKTAELAKYLPKNDDIYYGPAEYETTIKSKYITESSSSPFRVTQVSSNNLPGGLSEIKVITTGTNNTKSPPQILLLPNYPLLFGLGTSTTQVQPVFTTVQPTIPPSPNTPVGPSNAFDYRGFGSTNKGIGVVASFVVARENEFATIGLFPVMPKEFRGIRFPVPNRSPFLITGGTISQSFQSEYRGFTAREVTFDRRGGATLFRFIFAESGKYFEKTCPPTPGDCETTIIYDF